MGAVREMTVLLKVPAAEFDPEEFSTSSLIDNMDTHYRVIEKYREVTDADGNWWQNRDGDTLDVKALLESTHLYRVDVRWVDEFADED